VWFFFAAPVPASTARKTGCHLITETMSRRHQATRQGSVVDVRSAESVDGDGDDDAATP
jgi:hypothetical protein